MTEQEQTEKAPAAEPIIWRGYDEGEDSDEACEWDQGHGERCVYWPDCQVNGDHPNPFIYPSTRPAITDLGSS